MTEASTWNAPSEISTVCEDMFRPFLERHERIASNPEVGGGGQNAMPSGYPKFKNDLGAREIKIGALQFACIGASPPDDHPHIYLDIGTGDQIVCPYCATVFRYDSALAPFAADPSECAFLE